MKILMAALFPVGGIRTFLRYVYSQQCFEDCHITLLAPSDDLGAYLSRYIPAERLVVINAGDDFRAMLRQIRATLKEGRFDLLHSHGLTTGVAAELARMGSGVPHLLTVHDVFLPTTFRGLGGQARRWGLNLLLRRCDAVHAVGEDCAENFRSYMPWVRKDRIHAILNGIDTQRFAAAVPVDARAILGLSADTALIGFFGRFMAQKGFRTLVDAVEILVREGLPRPLRVLTFGWGGFIREDYQYLRDKGLDQYFLQQPQTDEPERWMKAMNVVAMPSRWEACPLQPMEALAAGVPIVGTSCIGLREVLQSTPAIMVAPGDARAFSRGLREAISGDCRKRFVDHSETACARYDVARCSDGMRALYKSLLA